MVLTQKHAKFILTVSPIASLLCHVLTYDVQLRQTYSDRVPT
jgi:hypothetical protein